MPTAFERFMATVQSNQREWIDDYDLDALRELGPEERATAEQTLIARLDTGDPRAPRALAEMGAQAAVEPLRGCLEACRGAMRVEVALALLKLAQFDGAAAAILPVLADESAQDRLHAAYALRDFPSPEVTRALLDAAGGDADRDVRTTAATSLLLTLGVLSSPFDDSRKDLMIRLDSDDPHAVSAAAEELRGLAGPGAADSAGRADGDKRAMSISRQALKALAALHALELGPLSPLAVMAPPAGPVAAEEMAVWLEALSGPWEWAAPALVDPQRTMALLYAGQSHGQVGQYVFPDRDGAGPAFSADWAGEALEMRGPWSAGELRVALLGPFSLDTMAETPPARLELTRRHLWALAAFVDAHRAARLARSLLRRGGLPEGLSIAEVVEAWRNGVSTADPEWSVSLLSRLVPDALPGGFEAEVPGILAEMAAVGLLQKVDIGSAGTDYYGPRGDVERLCLELSGSGAVFGLVLRLLKGDGRLETGTLFGWRTVGGIWLVDFGGADGDSLAVVKAGPSLFTAFAAGLVPGSPGEEPGTAFSMETPCSRDALVSRLRAGTESAESAVTGGDTVADEKVPAPRAFCTACGEPLREEASFCAGCGRPVGGPPPQQASCTACGEPLKQGASFCAGCGRPV